MSLARLTEPDEGDAMVAATVAAARARFAAAKANAAPLVRVRTSEHTDHDCPHCADMAEELRQLRETLFGERFLAPIMAWGGASAQEARLFAALLTRPIATKEALHIALYGLDPEGGAEIKIVDVIVCKVRAKLARRGFGDVIDTIWGVGYKISADKRAMFTAMFESGEALPGPALLPAPIGDPEWPVSAAARGRALWREGKSGSAIARLLGEEGLGVFSRSAVLSKARRDKWGERDRNGALLQPRRLADV